VRGGGTRVLLRKREENLDEPKTCRSNTKGGQPNIPLGKKLGTKKGSVEKLSSNHLQGRKLLKKREKKTRKKKQ